MRILLFYQYYHNPDCAAAGRHFQFAKTLGRNHEVHIITSDTWEGQRQTQVFDWSPPGVSVHSFPVAYSNAMSVRERFSAYAGYAWGAIRNGLKMPRPDVIIGTSTPLSAAWAAAKVARIRQIPWIFEVRDLWPDFPFQMGAIPYPWVRKRVYALEKRLYRSAAHVVTLSTDMESHVLNQGIEASSVTTLENGTDLYLNDRISDTDVDALRSFHGLDGKKVVLYAGTFGRANAVPAMIETARRMAYQEDVQFVFIGNGFYSSDLKEAAQTLQNVSVYPPEPRHRVFAWFRLASLSLVPFIDLPVLAANSPAKFFDSLAAGTPVLVTNSGWTQTFVENHQCGWHTPNAEPESMVRGIEVALSDSAELHRAGQNGRRVAYRLFDRIRMAERLESILEQCVYREHASIVEN